MSHLPGLLALAALLAVAARLVRHRRRGPADALLVGVGGVLVALVLAGMALGVAGLLRPAAWAVAVAALAVAGLVADRLLGRSGTPDSRPAPRDPRPGRRSGLLPVLPVLPWAVVSVVVVTVAVGLSARSLSAADEPPLQMAFGVVDGTAVQVVVSAGDAVGPLELRTTFDGTDISYPLFEVGADDPETTTLSLPTTGRVVVTLNYPDQTQPLRTLILDR